MNAPGGEDCIEGCCGKDYRIQAAGECSDEGGFELPIQGQPTRMLKAGDAFQIPPETPHAGGKPGDAKTRVLITYIVEKGKPLASPA